MRWRSYKNSTVGDIRYKEQFLLFPKRINNEWRWLERVKYKQIYKKYYYYNAYGERSYCYQWDNIEWIN